MGKIWIIADTTYRETARQPLYYILLGFFALAIYLSRYFTLFAFQPGDEANMIREMGIASITVCGILLSVVMSSIVITSEVEKLTTLTVLSKPIGRGEFLVGKYLGIVIANLLGIGFLFLIFSYTLWIKEIEPDLERIVDTLDNPGSGRIILPEIWIPFHGAEPLTFGVYNLLMKFWNEVVDPILRGTVLSFFQVSILCALAVGIAPHFSLVVNATASFVLFALGHLTQYIHLRAEDAQIAYRLLVQVLYLVFPNLGYFNAASLLASKSTISYHYVGATAAYGVLYIAAVLFVANLFFSRKEVK